MFLLIFFFFNVYFMFSHVILMKFMQLIWMDRRGVASRAPACCSGRCTCSRSHTGTGTSSGSDECSSRARQKTALKWNLFHSGCSGTVCPPLLCASFSRAARFDWKPHHRCCRWSLERGNSSCDSSDDTDSSLQCGIQDIPWVCHSVLFFCDLPMLKGCLPGIHIGRRQWIEGGLVCDSQDLLRFWNIFHTGHNHSIPCAQP